MIRPSTRIVLALTSVFAGHAALAASSYDAQYRAEFRPESGTIHVELRLSGKKLPSRIEFQRDPRRHVAFSGTGTLDVQQDTVTWQPKGDASRLGFDFIVNRERTPGRYDSLMTRDWAVFRADKLVPPARVKAVRGLGSRATLTFGLPAGWAISTAYPLAADGAFDIADPGRRFDRPQGWMLAGKIGTRNSLIDGVQTYVSAPLGDNARRQDLLAFVNWHLPHLIRVIPTLPKRLLIVTAGDPMWHGGLSGPASLFVHADRPMISENRTSTLLHELVHVAMGVRGDDESDWIVEGFAEYYSIELLRRAGSISRQRYEETLRKLGEWGENSPELFTKSASGPQTARAVIVLNSADQEIRRATNNKASLDDVARELAARGEEVSLDLLQSIAAKFARRPVLSLDRSRLLAAR
jgi:hypothetical protein